MPIRMFYTLELLYSASFSYEKAAGRRTKLSRFMHREFPAQPISSTFLMTPAIRGNTFLLV